MAGFGGLLEEQAEDDQVNGMMGLDPRLIQAGRKMRPEQFERYLRGLVDTGPGTDGFMQSIAQAAKMFGVRSPFDRAFNRPPAERGGPVGPSGRPRPLERMPEDHGLMSEDYQYPYK